MFRKRIKDKVRQAAIKLLGMEFDAEHRVDDPHVKIDPDNIDLDKIPKVVDGDGDTPGPNHKEDIGRTWVSAQLTGGVAPVFVDIRTPAEMATGVLPGAIRLPRHSVKDHLDRLPKPSQRVTIYDQTGDQESTMVAAWLRQNGWPLARRLRGGFSEWLEHGETTETPTIDGKRDVGDTVCLDDGRSGTVADESTQGTWVWLDDGELVGPVTLSD